MAVVQERHDRVLIIRIEREEKRNAIDRATTQGIEAALDRLDGDPRLLVGVLTGTATVFSAGTDLNEPVSPATERGGEYGVIRRQRVKPLIAAVEGPAFGGGFEIVLASDLVVASTTARFALPESRRGLVASSGGCSARSGRCPSMSRGSSCSPAPNSTSTGPTSWGWSTASRRRAARWSKPWRWPGRSARRPPSA